MGLRAKFADQKEIAFGDIGGAYTAIGTAFDQNGRVLFVDNFTDKTLQFSFDGINDHFVVGGSGAKAIDITSNRDEAIGELSSPKGQILYVKTIAAFGAPTSGSVYVSLVYGEK